MHPFSMAVNHCTSTKHGKIGSSLTLCLEWWKEGRKERIGKERKQFPLFGYRCEEEVGGGIGVMYFYPAHFRICPKWTEKEEMMVAWFENILDKITNIHISYAQPQKRKLHNEK